MTPYPVFGDTVDVSYKWIGTLWNTVGGNKTVYCKPRPAYRKGI